MASVERAGLEQHHEDQGGGAHRPDGRVAHDGQRLGAAAPRAERVGEVGQPVEVQAAGDAAATVASAKSGGTRFGGLCSSTRTRISTPAAGSQTSTPTSGASDMAVPI